MLTPAPPQSFSAHRNQHCHPANLGNMGILTSTEVGKAVNLLVAAHARVGAVLGDDEPVRTEGLARVAAEDVALDEHLVVGARVDGLVSKVLVEVVVDVLVAEAAGGTARSRAAPVVVVVGDVQVAPVDVAQGVAVADEGRLPVVVEVVPRDSDPVGRADNVELAVLSVYQSLAPAHLSVHVSGM